MKLDSRDISILQVLSRQGRISKSALAKRVNLSAAACWERLQRLEKAGAIETYSARIALRRLVPHITVFVMVELGAHRAESFQRFEAVIAQHDEITGCWALGGGFDYLLLVTTRDIDSYQHLMDALLEQNSGLTRYFTYIVTKAIKDAPPPLAALMAASEG
ncbi:Lrp/AsnC family transcriptional regulator [Sedimentitalea nanhaiensis]|uniref:Lrp/AsnC family transcriptional regulator n=1 Tax=Sedimentitalea nanhaiensis TaxID=999627 RepID=UPI000480833B|nr:Lrp/AsnC family transcriptional regulator [Sedimentitalea nanhaiensis]